MSTPTRVYLTKQGDIVRLVRAVNVAQARNHVARDSISVEVASQDDLIAYLTANPPAPVEEATARAQDLASAPGAQGASGESSE